MQSMRNGNTWTKLEDRGHPHGFKLKAFLEERNAISLPEILDISAQKYENQLCIGTRQLLQRIKVENEDGRQMEKLVQGEYVWKSYRDVQLESLHVSAAMMSLGFQKGQRVAFIAETRSEWLACAIGCLRYGLTAVTLYVNLCDNGLCHGINETEVDTVFTSFDILPRIMKILPECPLLKHVVVFEDQLEGIGSSYSDSSLIIPFQKLLTLGNPKELDQSYKPSCSDTAIIMYTSGSTGTPKGVAMSHKNIFYSFIAYTIQANLSDSDRYIAYLPLAHIMELVTEIALLSLGVTIAYSSPFTLTNNSPKVPKGGIGDARLAKPTAITAVPLILDRIIKAVSSTVEKQGKFKSRIFKYALRLKQKNQTSFTAHVLDIIIFNKVKEELGGSVKMMVVGGAPLAPQTHSLIRAMFGCTLQVGYGCTETCGCIASMEYDDSGTGHVGPPNPFVMVKLENWEEGDYRTTDKPRPRGEIIVGGPCVTRGYFNLPNESSKAFFVSNGVQWFRTGDIGEFDDNGLLYVIDRKHDLRKLKHGEYISLGTIESKLKTCSLVENICVFADSKEEYPVAIIIPTPTGLKKIATDAGIPAEEPVEKLCRDKLVLQTVLDKVKSHGKMCGLKKWDIPMAIYLTDLPWTPDNGLVTAAFKLKRKAIEKQYADQINSMYKKS